MTKETCQSLAISVLVSLIEFSIALGEEPCDSFGKIPYQSNTPISEKVIRDIS